jgi:ABC-type tungstate transport system permease subunit
MDHPARFAHRSGDGSHARACRYNIACARARTSAPALRGEDVVTKVFSAAVVLAFSLLTTQANTAELRVISAQGPREVLKELMPKFERASGHTVMMLFTETGEIRTRIAAGANFDVIIMPSAATDELVK